MVSITGLIKVLMVCPTKDLIMALMETETLDLMEDLTKDLMEGITKDLIRVSTVALMEDHLETKIVSIAVEAENTLQVIVLPAKGRELFLSLILLRDARDVMEVENNLRALVVFVEDVGGYWGSNQHFKILLLFKKNVGSAQVPVEASPMTALGAVAEG